MAAPSTYISAILSESSSGFGLTEAENLFVGIIPEGVTLPAIGILDSGGFPPEMNYTYRKATIQLRIRGEVGAYESAYSLIESICEYLNGMTEEMPTSFLRIIQIAQMGDILFLGFDESERPEFTANFLIHFTK